MDCYAILLHSSEPCHLSLGELMYGIPEEQAHLFVGEYAQDVLGYKLVFKSIVHQVLRAYSAVQETFDFFDQAFLKPLVQP